MVTSPIRTKEEIEKMKDYYLTKSHFRDYALFVIGINTALRISDLLRLRWRDVYDAQTRRYKNHIDIYEQKTKKHAVIALNSSCISAFKMLKKKKPFRRDDEFIFCGGKNRYQPLSRNRAYHIIKDAAAASHVEGNISCHSLRKTFGYHAWKMGTPTALIMNIYNHSSIEITKRYLSIYQDDKDALYKSMNL
ncbi:MAG: tyrosine-type recombinase/integrase [Eubacterium sp.]|nr:tyrosine-type recombinase/integrase [Eubacterium sp.]